MARPPVHINGPAPTYVDVNHDVHVTHHTNVHHHRGQTQHIQGATPPPVHIQSQGAHVTVGRAEQHRGALRSPPPQQRPAIAPPQQQRAPQQMRLPAPQPQMRMPAPQRQAPPQIEHRPYETMNTGSKRGFLHQMIRGPERKR